MKYSQQLGEIAGKHSSSAKQLLEEVDGEDVGSSDGFEQHLVKLVTCEQPLGTKVSVLANSSEASASPGKAPWVVELTPDLFARCG